MQSLFEILRRNRTVIVLFTTMVIMPCVFLGYLGFRAIRTDDAELKFLQRNRQREIALLLESRLKHWLFSPQADGAASEALLRFTTEGDRIVFPDFKVSNPQEIQRNRGPVDSPTPGSEPGSSAPGQGPVPSMQQVDEVYYPRIQVFLRDFKLTQNSGAQYFRRLKAMIVQVPGTPNGYVLESSKLTKFSERALDEMTASENFSGHFLIAEAGEPGFGGEEVVSFSDYTFFHVAFRPKDNPPAPLRANILLYSTVLLTLITALGGLFLYRVVAYEMAVVQLRADFVSAVSHEFRTPLSAILALLERIESGRVVDRDMLDRYHQTLRQEARRLGLLGDKLVDFAQIEERKKKLSFEKVSLDEIVNEAVSAFEQSNYPGHVEQCKSPSDSPASIVGDRTAIVHCVQNLIENALKYSPDGTTVLVRSGLRAGVPFVEVVDRGIGISVRDQQRIFEKFYRADNGRALNVQGTGIGLALVKRIIESHGGSVTVESTPNQGSCFRLMFAKCEGGR